MYCGEEYDGKRTASKEIEKVIGVQTSTDQAKNLSGHTMREETLDRERKTPVLSGADRGAPSMYGAEMALLALEGCDT